MSGQLGMGAMLHLLGGGSENSADKYYGKKILDVKKVERESRYSSDRNPDALEISFDDGTTIQLWDNGQSCCESRYMTLDDDIEDLKGQILKSITVEYKGMGKHDEDFGDRHEQAFVKIQGDKSAITISTHNEHNGYYGGFGLTITENK